MMVSERNQPWTLKQSTVPWVFLSSFLVYNTNMPRKKGSCSYPEGSCGRQALCSGTCGNCKRHCACPSSGQEIHTTPKPIRSNRDDVDLAIQMASLNMTPLQIIANERVEVERLRVASSPQAKLLNVFRDLLTFSKHHKRSLHGDAYALIRAVLTANLDDDEMKELQDDAGVAGGERLSFKSYARNRGYGDYQRIFEGQVDDEGSTESEDILSRSRVPDGVISHAVGFIVGRCQFLSWGEKRVATNSTGGGNGDVTTIPRLTRKCTASEMWRDYEANMCSNQQMFRCFHSYEGPLRSGAANYKGSSFNIEIEWHDGSTSMEPLHVLAQEDPVSCAVFGWKHDLLDEKGWKRLQGYVDMESISGEPKGSCTMKATKGVRKMIGKTAFLGLVRTLTAEDEQLITAVDYVKGVLVHDVVDVLQRIIHDHVIDPSSKASLTKMLMVLSNFLKNQYQRHAILLHGGQNTGTHGVHHGLSVLPHEAAKHYSFFTREELDKELEVRCIKLKKRATSMHAKIVALEEDDESKDVEATSRTSQCSSVVGSSSTSLHDDTSAADEESTREELTICHDDDSDECLGCSFLHYFMLSVLPEAVGRERTEGNKESVDNALSFIEDAHEKFMLYQGHVVRTANQSAALHELDVQLKQRCAVEMNAEARSLWVIIDFKMKWEAMHQ